ncbi:hypothetical protein ACQKO5_01035 [Novosphingobium subterraneum]|uniref:hypothetical protein n=1 Tax=Novosphingobium subterraneum TaxID=48936 RepID=UPI003D030EF1
MLFDRFATVMIAIGAGLGLAVTSTIPTRMPTPERPYPAARQDAYPEITAVTYESYPVASAPIFHRPMRIAYWEQPLEEPKDLPPADAIPDYEDYEIAPDPQVIEDEEADLTAQADREMRQEAIVMNIVPTAT